MGYARTAAASVSKLHLTNVDAKGVVSTPGIERIPPHSGAQAACPAQYISIGSVFFVVCRVSGLTQAGVCTSQLLLCQDGKVVMRIILWCQQGHVRVRR